MSNHKVYRIKLTSEEREALTQVAKGTGGQLKIAVWKVERAHAMLMCDEGKEGPAWSYEIIAETFATTTRSLENWRKQAAFQGPLSLLERKERVTPPTAPTLDGDKEARLTKILCSTPPDVRTRRVASPSECVPELDGQYANPFGPSFLAFKLAQHRQNHDGVRGP